jgi:hypothetical protein
MNFAWLTFVDGRKLVMFADEIEKHGEQVAEADASN